MTILAYTMSAPDGGGFYFPDDGAGILCPECGVCIDKSYVPTNLVMSKKSYEVSYTYDLRMIVSERFKSYCEDYAIAGAVFTSVNPNQKLYVMTSDRIAKVDPVRQQTEFGDICNVCGQHREVTIAFPCYLKDQIEPLEPGIYRSDLEYGSGRERAPIFILGLETKAVIEVGSFKQTMFEEVVL